MTFKVLTNRFANHKKGSTIDGDALVGANIQALIEGGHIAPVEKTPKPDKEEPKEK